MSQVKEMPTNLLDDLFRRRDEQREWKKTAILVVKGKELPIERNRMGLYKWYAHPALTNVASRSLLRWMQIIPPGSRSGKQRHQGGRVHFVLEGRGYTILDEVRHDWERGDLIVIPIKPHGTVFQHFNSDPEKQVRLLAAEPNFVDCLGVDMGASFEVLEDSPDYKP